MLITGTEKCGRCGRINEWEYLIGQNINSRFLYADSLDDNKIHPYKQEQLNENMYLLQYRCKYCDALNSFEYYYGGHGRL